MYHLLVACLRPYVLLNLIMAVGFVVLWVKVRPRRWLMIPVVAWLVLMTMSSQLVSYGLIGTLEWSYPPPHKLPTDIKTIVVLSGDHLPPDRIRLTAQPGCTTTVRCRYAAQLYHERGRLSIIVTGGKAKESTAGPGCAAVMRQLLLDLGVMDSDIRVESNSRSTFENAVETAKLLRDEEEPTTLLVTDAFHMRRAAACFRKQGLNVFPAPCGHRATQLPSSITDLLLPSGGAIEGTHLALHEWLGICWYRIKGRI